MRAIVQTKRTCALPCALVFVVAACFATAASAGELKVMTSGGFTAAYRELVPEFERTTGITIITAYGASMGGAPDSIPSRLDRGEPVDVVILASAALDDLIRRGRVVRSTRMDLVRSAIGIAVRAGTARPDISSVDALKRTLLAARSVAYSDSASGVYVSTELFSRLGIAAEMLSKSRKTGGMVGEAVARGEAEIGFQQISELLAVKGIDYVGPLPAGAQRVTVFSAGIAVKSATPEAAALLLRFLASKAAVPAIVKSGLEPIRRQ